MKSWYVHALLAHALLLTAACEAEQIDYGNVCLSSSVAGDAHELLVLASSSDCASDHEGAEFSCSVTEEDGVFVVHTRFQEGRDPNGACAGPRTARCSITAPEGTHEVEFAGDRATVSIPSQDSTCLPPGTLPED